MPLTNSFQQCGTHGCTQERGHMGVCGLFNKLPDDQHERLKWDLHQHVNVRAWKAKMSPSIDTNLATFMGFSRDPQTLKVHPNATYFCTGYCTGGVSYYQFEHKDSETRFPVNISDKKYKYPLETIEHFYQKFCKKKNTQKKQKKDTLVEEDDVEDDEEDDDVDDEEDMTRKPTSVTQAVAQIEESGAAVPMASMAVSNPPSPTSNQATNSVVLALSGVSVSRSSSPRVATPAKRPIEMVFQNVSETIKSAILKQIEDEHFLRFDTVMEALEAFENEHEDTKKTFVVCIMNKMQESLAKTLLKKRLELFFKLE